MVIMKIRLGVEDRKKNQYRIDLSLTHKVDYEETNHNFTENQSL